MTPKSHDADEEVYDDLIEALRSARDRGPWTETAVRTASANPDQVKAMSDACTACSRPCERGEVCTTVVAKRRSLFGQMGREQAYHLIEGGVRRLDAKGEVDVRQADRPRPNTFVQLNDSDRNGGTEG